MSQLNTPLYLDIYNQLLRQIETGTYGEGIKLPSEKEVAIQYGVSTITTKKAFEMLAEQGIIKRIPGRGSFVSERKDDEESVEECVGKEVDKKLIGLIMEDISENYGLFTVASIEKVCDELGYSMLLKRSYGSQDKEEKAIQDLIEMGAKGIIIMPVHGENYASAILKLAVEKFPLVLIDRELKGIPVSFVGTDNYEAAYEMTDYLFDLGHKNICLVTPLDTATFTVQERKRGFLESSMKHGIIVDENNFINEIRSTLPAINTMEALPGDLELVKNYIKGNKHITAFFAIEYNIALIINRSIKELGFKIPEDYTITCFDSPPNFVDEYPLTFIRQNEEIIGRRAVERLVKFIEGDDSIEKIYVPTEIIKGNSVVDLENVKST